MHRNSGNFFKDVKDKTIIFIYASGLRSDVPDDILHLPFHRDDVVSMALCRRFGRQRTGNFRNCRTILLCGPLDGADGSAACHTSCIADALRQSWRTLRAYGNEIVGHIAAKSYEPADSLHILNLYRSIFLPKQRIAKVAGKDVDTSVLDAAKIAGARHSGRSILRPDNRIQPLR